MGIAEAIAALEVARASSGSVADRALDGLWTVQIGDLAWCAVGLGALVLARPGGTGARIARGAAVAVALLAGAIAVGALASGWGGGRVDASVLQTCARLVAGIAAAALFALLAQRVGRTPVHGDERWQAPSPDAPRPDASTWRARGEALVASDLAFSPRRVEALQALAALREAAATGDPELAREAYLAVARLRS